MTPLILLAFPVKSILLFFLVKVSAGVHFMFAQGIPEAFRLVELDENPSKGNFPNITTTEREEGKSPAL